MTQWGRGAGLVAAADTPNGRYGQRSVGLAVLAFAIGLVSLILWINVPKEVGEDWQEITTVAFMIAFLGITPLIHTIGFVFALIAVFRSGERRGLGLLGLVLNSVSVLVGIGLVYAAAVSMASFT